MVSTWDKSEVDIIKAWDSNGFDLCQTSLVKVLIADKQKSGPKRKVICTGLWDEVMDSIHSDDDISSLQMMIQLTHFSWVLLPAHEVPSSPVILYAIVILSMQP